MADKDEQIDADILRSKADILRARDTVPPYKKETPQETDSQEVGAEPSPSGVSSEMSPKKQETSAKDTPEVAAESASAQQERTEVPRFDLAEQIMAEQRKITAVRRKAPGEKTEPLSEKPGAKAFGNATKQATQEPSQEEQIVAEIVARDIEKLMRGDNPLGPG